MPHGLLKKIAMGLLLIPTAILLLFTFGETFGGDLSGLSHLLQLAPLALLIFLAYKKPRIGGILLLAIGLALGVLYPLTAPFKLQTILIVETLLFLPPVLAGALLILSTGARTSPQSPAPRTQAREQFRG